MLSREASPDAERLLEQAFGGDADLQLRMIDRYHDLYGLPHLMRRQRLEPELFQHELDLQYVVLAIANPALNVLLTSYRRERVWALVGGMIRRGERIEDTLTRLVETETRLKVDEVEPLAMVTNLFESKHRTAKHRGIAFLVRTRGVPEARPHRRLQYVSQPPQHMMFATNRDVLKLAFERLGHLSERPPLDEVDVSRGHQLQARLHGLLVKPFGASSSRRLRARVHAYADGSQTILDAACGDDPLVLELAQKARLVVANDVSWEALTQLRARVATGNVIFSNHNALQLPYRTPFDLVICKNVMHHMHDRDELFGLARSLAQVGRRILLVDVENPLRGPRSARLWHAYYVHWLGDRGGYFLTLDQFQAFVRAAFPGGKVSFDRVSTGKGNYLFACVELNRHGLRPRLAGANLTVARSVPTQLLAYVRRVIAG
jgi:ADP-ribose pyrophosphatase YjhB (NUDIX family)